MSFIKCGDAEDINVIQPLELTDEETKKKLDELKSEMNQEPSVLVAKEQE